MSEQPAPTTNVRLWLTLSLVAFTAGVGSWILVIVLLRETV